MRKDKKPATSEAEEDDIDLKSELEESIEKMNGLIKSEGSVSVKELLSDEKTRGLIKAEMEKYDDDDDDDDDEEEEKKMKGKKYMKGKGKKMKKSEAEENFEDVVEDNEDVIDAVPVLKSFCGVMSNVIDELGDLKETISDLQKSHDETNEIQKSFVEVINSSTELVKSMSENIDSIGSAPKKVKGKINKEDIIQKAGFDEDGEEIVKSDLPSKAAVRGILLKAAQEGEVSSTDVSRWELSGYKFDAMSSAAQNFVAQKLSIPAPQPQGGGE